jgi:hypothetical protein
MPATGKLKGNDLECQPTATARERAAVRSHVQGGVVEAPPLMDRPGQSDAAGRHREVVDRDLSNEAKRPATGLYALTGVGILQEGGAAKASVKATHLAKWIAPKSHRAPLQGANVLVARTIHIREHPATRPHLVDDRGPIGEHHPLANARTGPVNAWKTQRPHQSLHDPRTQAHVIVEEHDRLAFREGKREVPRVGEFPDGTGQ